MTLDQVLVAAARAAGEWPSPEPFLYVLSRWNPIDRDADAFRLAIALDVDLIWAADRVTAQVAGHRVEVTFGVERIGDGFDELSGKPAFHFEDKAGGARFAICHCVADMQIDRERAAKRAKIQSEIDDEARKRASPSTKAIVSKSATST